MTKLSSSLSSTAPRLFEELVGDNTSSLGVDGTEAGGTLVVAGVTTATGGVEVPDNAVIKLGTDDDLQLYKDASHSRIRNSTNDLSLQSDSIALRNYEGTQNYVTGTENAAVDLYFSGNKKAETTNEGLKITGITSTTTLEVNERYGVSKVSCCKSRKN